MRCKCGHDQDEHFSGKFNCTHVLEKIPDKQMIMGLPKTIYSYKICDCDKFEAE